MREWENVRTLTQRAVTQTMETTLISEMKSKSVTVANTQPKMREPIFYIDKAREDEIRKAVQILHRGIQQAGEVACNILHCLVGKFVSNTI